VIEHYKQLAQEIVEFGKKLGADTVSTSLVNATSFQVEVRDQRIESLKESGSAGMYVTLCKDQRRSTISSNDLRPETLHPLMRQAMEAIPFMGKDPFYSLPEPELQGRADAQLTFVDERFDEHTSEEKIELAMQIERATLAQSKQLKTEQSYYSDLRSHTVHADSNGFVDGYSKTLYSLGISVVAEDQAAAGNNTGRKQTDGWYSSARFLDRLEPMETVAQRACERTLRKLGAIKPKTCEVPVVFSAEMARSFLGSCASAMMGDHVFRKQSFLMNRLGESVANAQIQLSDQPLLPEMLGSRYFDSEGVRAKPLSLLENGVLRNFMLSTYAANKLKMRSTGHAGGLSNLVLEPGTHSEEDLIASVKDGLYLTFMSGQGVNVTTGDYSRGAQGLWIRNGQLAEPVSEFTIASTFQNMLRNLDMLGRDVDARNPILTPAFRIAKMSVSGT
jgi:PmbA protein